MWPVQGEQHKLTKCFNREGNYQVLQSKRTLKDKESAGAILKKGHEVCTASCTCCSLSLEMLLLFQCGNKLLMDSVSVLP